MTKEKAAKSTRPESQRHLIRRIEHLEEGLQRIIETTSPPLFSVERKVKWLAHKYLKEKS